MTGDLTEPLQQLLLLSKSIVLPLVLNPSNSHNMPKAMLKEATAELHRFVANGEACHVHKEIDLPASSDSALACLLRK